MDIVSLPVQRYIPLFHSILVCTKRWHNPPSHRTLAVHGCHRRAVCWCTYSCGGCAVGGPLAWSWWCPCRACSAAGTRCWCGRRTPSYGGSGPRTWTRRRPAERPFRLTRPVRRGPRRCGCWTNDVCLAATWNTSVTDIHWQRTSSYITIFIFEHLQKLIIYIITESSSKVHCDLKDSDTPFVALCAR